MSAIDLLSHTGYIMYNKQIARTLGVNEAILIGELCAKFQFFSDLGQLEDSDGWFYLTREDIENDTCLSPRQQRPAFENLGKIGLVECELREVPARMFYRLKIENLNNLILQNVTSGCDEMLQQGVTKCKNINKESKKENKKENKYNCAFEPYFEQLWAMYPSKKGRQRVTASDKARLEKAGFEQIKRCIERYLEGLKKEPWRIPQNGSTFFHSGYIDYLDENYMKTEPPHDICSSSAGKDEKFLEFWKKYPRKASYPEAAAAWAQINPDEKLFEEIMAGLSKALKCDQWVRDGKRYIPYPATWLNQRRWEDELPTAADATDLEIMN